MITVNIHPTTIIGHDVTIGLNTEIGAFSIIENNVAIGENCWIGNHVTIKQYTRLGKRCKVFHGSVIGEIPQDLKFEEEETTVEIGNDVTIREFVTIHRGSNARKKTEIRDHSYIMTYVHIAHDCLIGENVILVNSVQLGGHVTVDDGAMIGGVVAIHQFCKIGKTALVAGGYRVVQDVPPYVLVAGEPLKFCGVNSVGLRRQGFSVDSRRDIKRAYHLLYHSSMNRTQALAEIKKTLLPGKEIEEIISFAKNSERGLV